MRNIALIIFVTKGEGEKLKTVLIPSREINEEEGIRPFEEETAIEANLIKIRTSDPLFRSLHSVKRMKRLQITQSCQLSLRDFECFL